MPLENEHGNTQGADSSGRVPGAIREVSFTHHAVGQYLEGTSNPVVNTFRSDWKVTYSGASSGRTCGRLFITPNPDGGSGGNVLQVAYMPNLVGGSTGMVFTAPLTAGLYDPGSPMPPDVQYTDLWFQYQVYFPRDFDFVRGGKLPGLASWDKPSGCIKNDTFGGFSTRSMWHYLHPDEVEPPLQKSAFVLAAYFYSPWKDEECGDYYMFCQSDPVNPPQAPVRDCAQPIMAAGGRWLTLKQHVRLNTISSANEPLADGLFQEYLVDENGSHLVLELTNIRLRDWSYKDANGNYTGVTPYISCIAMETFFGGSDVATWAPRTMQFAYFNNFLVTEEDPTPSGLHSRD